LYFYFFFQAEDGIRDRNVTGVQTCALPILPVCLSSLYCIKYLLSIISELTSKYFLIALFISSSLMASSVLFELKMSFSVNLLTSVGACLSLCCCSSFESSLEHAASIAVSMSTNDKNILFFIERTTPLIIVLFIS